MKIKSSVEALGLNLACSQPALFSIEHATIEY